MNNIIVISKVELMALVEESLNFHIEGLKKEIRNNLNPPKLNFTVKDASIELGVAELTVHNYIKKGILSASKIGRRIVIKRSDLEEALKEVKSLKHKR
jgi:excisionase family DNA binding protein